MKQPNQNTNDTFRIHTDVKSEEDLLPPGAEPGTVPTDLEQATGLERLEILGKMQGVDVFDMRPLDSTRLGTFSHRILDLWSRPAHRIEMEGFLALIGEPLENRKS